MCTWRPWLSEHRGSNRARLEMHLDAVTEWVWRYAHGGHESANLEAVIERVCYCPWRPRSSTIGGVLGGGHSGSGKSEGRRHWSWDSIHRLPHNCGNVENWVQHSLPRDERLAGSRRQLILGWCSTRCMHYSGYAELQVCLNLVYAVIGVNCWWLRWAIERDDLTSCC